MKILSVASVLFNDIHEASVGMGIILVTAVPRFECVGPAWDVEQNLHT